LLLARAPGLDRTTIYNLLSHSSSGDSTAANVAPINICVALTSVVKHATCPRDLLQAGGLPLPAAKD
jgi:hypothetical protein